MNENIKLQVIELAKTELKPGSKYIIALSPMYADYIGEFYNSLDFLDIKATIIPVEPHNMKIWEVAPEDV